jgi:hypothetical protein
MRHLGNLRTLGVFPCGECRAFVALTQGCRHHKPVKAHTENSARFDDLYGVMRLADSTRMRAVMQRAAGGKPVALADRLDRHVANSLTRAGLLTQAKRGGPYLITDKGRDVWRRTLPLLT